MSHRATSTSVARLYRIRVVASHLLRVILPYKRYTEHSLNNEQKSEHYNNRVAEPINNKLTSKLSRMAQGRYGTYMDSWRWAEKIKLRIQRRPWNLEPYDQWAHYVNGCNTNEKFIVTLLPEYNNMNLFIDMMFQQNVNVVVIPGEIEDEEAIDYCNYWNLPLKRDVPNRKYNLEQIGRAVGQSSTTFDLNVSSNENPDKDRLIRVFMFNNWPIHRAVPTDMHDFLKFIEEVNVANGSVVSDRETCNPIVVHSTEAGRAGLYCAIDIGMDYGAQNKEVWIDNIVHRVAQGRYTGGTTLDQCIFTSKAIEYCLKN